MGVTTNYYQVSLTSTTNWVLTAEQIQIATIWVQKVQFTTVLQVYYRLEDGF